MRFKEFVELSEGLQYHLDNKISLSENIYRVHSEQYYAMFREARKLLKEGKIEVDPMERELLETDIGEFVEYKGEMVPLDSPMLAEEKKKSEKKPIGKPMRSSGPKKYKVYVKDPKTGNVKTVNFGDASGGLSSKISDPEARKSFVARHKCSEKKDKTKAGYWSCRLPRYSKALGLSGGGNFFW